MDLSTGTQESSSSLETIGFLRIPLRPLPMPTLGPLHSSPLAPLGTLPPWHPFLHPLEPSLRAHCWIPSSFPPSLFSSSQAPLVSFWGPFPSSLGPLWGTFLCFLQPPSGPLPALPWGPYFCIPSFFVPSFSKTLIAPSSALLCPGAD
jgi:hypothetical protein